jgi:ribA/ribD-fused uncharacterized protein
VIVVLEMRRYARQDCALFRKTDEPFGGLSNMADFPLRVNGVPFRTSEALYQVCRFPRYPEVQQEIIDQASPMAAKMKSRRHNDKTRRDWAVVKFAVMRWCLQVKLCQHADRFSELLLSTGEKCIVEESHRDWYWGARPITDDLLEGCNMLGQLLAELRQDLQSSNGERLRSVDPPPIDDFLLLNRPIERVDADACFAPDHVPSPHTVRNPVY